MALIKIIANTILTSLTFKFLIPRIMIPLKGDVLMCKNITRVSFLTTITFSIPLPYPGKMKNQYLVFTLKLKLIVLVKMKLTSMN